MNGRTPRIAVIDKCPIRTDYKKYFDFDFDLKHLSSVYLQKVLKKDVDLELNPDDYDFIITVGSEATKHLAKVSVTNFAGLLVDDKYLPISNPAMLTFRPEGKPEFERAVDKINKYIKGEITSARVDGDFKGIDNADEAMEFLLEVLNSGAKVIAVDTETTALYPRDGYILGISISYKLKQGRYINTDILTDEHIEILQRIIENYHIVFHNRKFDQKWLEYHFSLKFAPDCDDTMVEHYVLDETEGSHGLKGLAIKYTTYGDYDAALEDFKKNYCATHNILSADFTYDLIPFDIISTYACLTHDSLVFMADGTKKTIGELVRTKSTDKVLSYNEKTGQYEDSRINGWVKQTHPSKEWYSIVTGMYTTETIKDSGIYRGPKFTSDHKVLLSRGWSEVSSIQVGDRILSQEFDLTPDSYQILYGSMLGDGRFDSRNTSGAGFMVSQAASRKNYAKFKAEALGCTKVKVIVGDVDGRRQDIYQYYSEYSLLYTDLFRSSIFREGTKVQKPKITTDFSSNLNIKAIAVWYMDDGNLAGSAPRIWSRTMSDTERRIMIERLEVLGLKGARFFEDSEKNNQFFTWDREFQDNFFKSIAPYIHTDCAYKIPEQYRKLVNTYYWDTIGDKPYYAIIYKKVPWNPPVNKRGYSTKWCINVENNHCFFTDVGLVHNCIDTAVTLELHYKFKPLIDKQPKLKWVYDNILIPGVEFLMNMEEVGIPMSEERLLASEKYLDKWIQEAKEEVYGFAEVKQFEQDTGAIFNPNSVQQLRKVLFDYLKLTPTGKLTKTGALSTDAEVLEELSEEHPLPAAILKVRQLGKIKSSYISKILPELDKDGRIRTNFNLTFTTSGRLSSSGKFNAQQIPRDDPIIKGCIQAPPGYKIISQDLQTGEVYYAAVLSGDKALQNVFKQGGDFHSTIAKQVFNLPCAVEDVKKLFSLDRQAAKAVTFGILYGSGPQKVADTVNKEGGNLTLEDAQQVIKQYFNTFKGLKKWLTDTQEFIKANGYVYSFFGRKRRLPNVFSTDKGIAAHEVRSGVNATIQSVCSDVNLLGAIDTANEFRANNMDAKVFMLVHDSIVCIVRDDLVEQAREILTRNTQKDRGCSIQGQPIGVDQDVGQDYSFDKFEKKYEIIGDCLARI